MPDYYILDQCIPWETFIVLIDFNATTGSGRVGYKLCACPHGSICFHGVVSMLNYKFIGLGSDPGLGSCHAAHPTFYSPFWVINGETWEVNCGNLDVESVQDAQHP